MARILWKLRFWVNPTRKIWSWDFWEFLADLRSFKISTENKPEKVLDDLICDQIRKAENSIELFCVEFPNSGFSDKMIFSVRSNFRFSNKNFEPRRKFDGNRNFDRKSKFWSKIGILIENRKFYRKSNFSSKIEIQKMSYFFKFGNFDNFCSIEL